jgi:8-oxo-dGTP pyrophosphatase MutT (NUDIX family)
MTVKKHPLYRGRVIQLNLENVVLPNGNNAELEIVYHPGGVAIIAEDNAGRLCLIRQYRHAAGDWLWEFPAGKREPGEAPQDTAQRELLEEVGVQARDWRKLGELVPSPGILTEVVQLYYARELSQSTHAHEDEEVIEIHWFTPEEIEEMVRQDRIVDGKTLVALYLLKAKRFKA